MINLGISNLQKIPKVFKSWFREISIKIEDFLMLYKTYKKKKVMVSCDLKDFDKYCFKKSLLSQNDEKNKKNRPSMPHQSAISLHISYFLVSQNGKASILLSPYRKPFSIIQK